MGDAAGELADGLESLRLLPALRLLGAAPEPAVGGGADEREGENEEGAERDADGEVAGGEQAADRGPGRPGVLKRAAAMPV